MSCTCEGLDELIRKLETEFSDKEIKNMEKKALEPVAQKIERDIREIAPICKEHLKHGRDAVGFRYVSSRGYIIGLDNQIKDPYGDYWETVRGLWFSQWSGGNNWKHIGWFTDYARANGRNYMEDGAKNLKKAIEIMLKNFT